MWYMLPSARAGWQSGYAPKPGAWLDFARMKGRRIRRRRQKAERRERYE
jgi:transposase